MYKLLLATLLATALHSHAQQATAQLHFVTDTVALGRPLQLIVTARYPATHQLLLPDTARGLGDFEVVGLHRPPVQVREGMRYDSITITLRSFSIASWQHAALQLVCYGPDTLRLATNTDSVRFVARVEPPIAQQQYKRDYSLIPLVPPVRYGLWAAVIGVALVMIGMAVYLLQKPLARWLALRRLHREWLALQNNLQVAYAQRQQDPTACINTLNRLWKAYLEGASTLHLRSLTARELPRTLAQLHYLSPSDHALLQQLCETEERVNYAHQPLPQQHLERDYSALLQVLAAVYGQRKGALRT